jgi:hypothetical protein
MYVYVIAGSDAGPSKIGRCIDTEERLRAIQTGSHERLRIYHVEPVGNAASTIEAAVHGALADRRTGGGRKWFNITPDGATGVIRATAAASGVLFDESTTLRQWSTKSVLTWLRQIEQRRIAHEEDDEAFDEDDAEGIAPPSPLQLFAGAVPSRFGKRFNFNDYLLSWNDGMWIRWAFERLGKRLPTARSLGPYLAADQFLESRQSKCGREVSSRWIEWSAGRDLSSAEARGLAIVWDKFVTAHNIVEQDQQRWPAYGTDDHVDDVHVMVLVGDAERGDRERIVFWHPDFRAVLVPVRRLKLWDISWGGTPTQLNNVSVAGFVAPPMPMDVWERPFLPWFQAASQRCNDSLGAFLANPNKRYPMRRPYDGVQDPPIVCQPLPCIDEHGTF